MLFRKRLPPVPTGYEYLDLLWSQLMPRAASYLDVLPSSPDPVWATEYGLRFVALGMLECQAVSAELHRTPPRSTLRRVRERRLHLLEQRQQDRALTLVAALVDQARKRFPKASPAQLLTVARDGFRGLLSAAFPVNGETHSHARHAQESLRPRNDNP